MVNAARFCLLAVPIKSKLCYRNDRYLLKSKTGHCVVSIFSFLIGGLAKLSKPHNQIINTRCTATWINIEPSVTIFHKLETFFFRVRESIGSINSKSVQHCVHIYHLNSKYTFWIRGWYYYNQLLPFSSTTKSFKCRMLRACL